MFVYVVLFCHLLLILCYMVILVHNETKERLRFCGNTFCHGFRNHEYCVYYICYLQFYFC